MTRCANIWGSAFIDQSTASPALSLPLIRWHFRRQMGLSGFFVEFWVPASEFAVDAVNLKVVSAVKWALVLQRSVSAENFRSALVMKRRKYQSHKLSYPTSTTGMTTASEIVFINHPNMPRVQCY